MMWGGPFEDPYEAARRQALFAMGQQGLMGLGGMGLGGRAGQQSMPRQAASKQYSTPLEGPKKPSFIDDLRSEIEYWVKDATYL